MFQKTKRILNTIRRHLPKLDLTLGLAAELLEAVTSPPPAQAPKLQRKRNHRLQ